MTRKRYHESRQRLVFITPAERATMNGTAAPKPGPPSCPDPLMAAYRDPVGRALVAAIHARKEAKARLRERVLEEAATALEEARVWGGRYGQTSRRPTGFLNAALWVRELRRGTPAT